MTIENIHDTADSGESAQVEFKRTTGTLSAAAKTVCGMLNGEGGYVLISVRDDGSVLGQEVADRTRREVARELSKIEPQVVIEPEFVPVENDRVEHDLRDLRQELLQIVGREGPVSLCDIKAEWASDAAEHTVQEHLQTLRDLDLLRLEGHGRGARWRLRENGRMSAVKITDEFGGLEKNTRRKMRKDADTMRDRIRAQRRARVVERSGGRKDAEKTQEDELRSGRTRRGRTLNAPIH